MLNCEAHHGARGGCLGRKVVAYQPMVGIRYVFCGSGEQRHLLGHRFRKTERMAEEAKRRIEIEAIEKNQAVQSDGHPGKLESVSPCQGLADCPLVPILQWYLHVCEALEQAS